MNLGNFIQLHLPFPNLTFLPQIHPQKPQEQESILIILVDRSPPDLHDRSHSKLFPQTQYEVFWP